MKFYSTVDGKEGGCWAALVDALLLDAMLILPWIVVLTAMILMYLLYRISLRRMRVLESVLSKHIKASISNHMLLLRIKVLESILLKHLKAFVPTAKENAAIDALGKALDIAQQGKNVDKKGD